MGRCLGLMIGISHYQDTAFQPLQYAETDAHTLAQWLVNAQGGKWLASDVQFLPGMYATRDSVESLITQLCLNEARSDDLVLIYFAGHAFLDEKSNEGYLALVDTDYQQPSTSLHLPSLAQQVLLASPAAHLVFMLDCFQTGALWSTHAAFPYDSKPLLGSSLVASLQQSSGRMFFCSCRGNVSTPESGEKNLGLLAYRMIVGLGGQAADPATGQISLQRLHAYLFNTLDAQHRPQLFGQEDTPLVLADRTSSPAHDSPIIPKESNQYSHPAVNPPVATKVSSQPQPSDSEPSYQPAVLQQCTMLLRQARMLIQTQNPTEALARVEQALHIEPKNSDALIIKGQLLGSMGRYPEAISLITQAEEVDSKNALAWSVHAALLTNIEQYQQALEAIGRSLKIDPTNIEAQTVKATILRQLGIEQPQGQDRFQEFEEASPHRTQRRRDNPKAFFIGTVIQSAALIVGGIGAIFPILLPDVPIVVALLLESLGLVFLCFNAARGSYLYGTPRLLLTIFTSLLAAAFLGALYKVDYQRIMQIVTDHHPLFLPLLFLGLWLALVAILPLLMAVGGVVFGARRSI